MGAIETKVFRNGDAMAIDLPAGLDLAPGTSVRIETIGNEMRITPVSQPIDDVIESKRRLTMLIEKLREIGPITPVGKREGIEFPDRRGLY